MFFITLLFLLQEKTTHQVIPAHSRRQGQEMGPHQEDRSGIQTLLPHKGD